MGLAVRVIPVILARGRTMVKGTQFNAWRSVGLAAQAVRVHQIRQCDEIVLLDIGATPEGRGPDLDLVRELSADCFSPLAVGGGVRSLADVRALLEAGADKVVCCTFALERQSFIEECAAIVGSQAIVVAIDVREPGYPCSRSGTMRWDLMGAATWARGVANAGAGEILLTSVEREGTMQGYDLDLIRSVSQAVGIPVIAHGGAGKYHDMVEAVQAGASAVAAGAMFQFTDQTPKDAARYLQQHGIEARIQ